MSKSSESKFTL